MGGDWYLEFTYTSKKNPRFCFAGPEWNQAVENALGTGTMLSGVDTIAYHTMGKNYVRFEKWTAWTASEPRDKALELVKNYVDDVTFVRSNDTPNSFS
ncbi:hypothetical protein V866_008529 [Kwoniella sp. B9012]